MRRLLTYWVSLVEQPHVHQIAAAKALAVAQTEIGSQVVDERLAILGTEVAGLLVFDDMSSDLPVGFDQLGVDGLHRPNPALGIGV